MVEIIYRESELRPTLEGVTDQPNGTSEELLDPGSRYTVKACPKLIRPELVRLIGKHKDIRNLSDAMKAVTAAGAVRINCMRPFQMIKTLLADEESSDPVLEEIRNQEQFYEIALGCTRVQLTCHLFPGTLSQIKSMAKVLRLPMENMVVIALTAGLASSEDWVPEPQRARCEEATERFGDWMVWRLREMGKPEAKVYLEAPRYLASCDPH